jgi:hypothetical protein
MKELLAVLLAFGLLLGASALAVESLGDRQTVVSPPDAVAEELVRALVNERFDQARAYLAEPETVTDDQLRALAASLGDPTTIESELTEAGRERALATVTTSSGARSQAHRFALVFEGDWQVDLENR